MRDNKPMKDRLQYMFQGSSVLQNCSPGPSTANARLTLRMV